MKPVITFFLLLGILAGCTCPAPCVVVVPPPTICGPYPRVSCPLEGELAEPCSEQVLINIYHNIHYQNPGFYPNGYYKNGYYSMRGYRH